MVRILPLSLIIVVFFLLAGRVAFSKPLTAHVNKNAIAQGNTIILTVDYEGKAKSEPELGPLEKDFTIVSRQTSHQSSFVNGDHREVTSWIFELVPRSSAKNLTIPAIKLGADSTSPIAIMQSPENSRSGSPDAIVVAMVPDRSEVYLNGEVIITITIKSPRVLRNATLSKLEIADAIVEPLIEGERSEEIEQGVKYNIFKQSYAIYPSKPGSLTIPPVLFRGVAVSDRQNGFGVPGFFSSGSSVSARSKELVLKVKDVPQEFPAGHQFLPLKSFIVVDAFDEANPRFEVNKATARHFEIKAKGTVASFLPSVAIPTQKNLQVYAESGSKVQNVESDGILSLAKFSHIYMPTNPGHVGVPEQVIYWWDVDGDKLKTTTIRALEFDVIGDAVVPPPQAHPSGDIVPNAQEEMQPASSPQGERGSVWQILALLFLLLWLGTTASLVWLWRAHRRKEIGKSDHENGDAKEKIDAVISACNSGNVKEAYVLTLALCDFADRYPERGVPGRELKSIIREMEKAWYDKNGDGNAKDLLPKIKACVQTVPKLPSSTTLAPLYPQ